MDEHEEECEVLWTEIKEAAEMIYNKGNRIPDYIWNIISLSYLYKCLENLRAQGIVKRKKGNSRYKPYVWALTDYGSRSVFPYLAKKHKKEL